MAVLVVDLAQEVEVGDEQRERTLVARRAVELGRKRLAQVAGIEQSRLRVDVGLLAELAHLQRRPDQDQWRDRKRNEDGLSPPKRGDDDPERAEARLRGEHGRQLLAHLAEREV